MNFYFEPDDRRSNFNENTDNFNENSEDWGQCAWVWDERRCCFRLIHRCHDRHRDEKEHERFRQHVHEFLGSTMISEEREEAHNHRFAGVSGPAIPTGGSHVHRIFTLTDSTDHIHRIEDTSGPAINVGGGRHVHLVRGRTSFEDGHTHGYIFATLIENPTGEGR
jgi:hypothetical protein